MSGGVRCRVPMLEVNPHVMCVLCGGYFIDATTIIECLHSFCRKCIVTYLESSRFCPICDVQVHKTKPLLSIRPDATLQDIVYKLVPGLYRDEMRRRREFYAARPTTELPCERGEARGEERRAVFAPDEVVEVRLQYCPRGTGGPGGPLSGSAAPQARFLRCPAVVTVGHLQHMLRCKHELAAGRRVELLARGEVLTPDLMLLDVAYLHCWRRVGPLQLYYRIVTVPLKRRFPSEPAPESAKLAISAATAARLSPEPPVTGGDAVVVPASAAESAAVCRESAVNPDTRRPLDPEVRVKCQGAAAGVAPVVALTAITLTSVSDTELTAVTTSAPTAPCATKTSSATCVTATATAVTPSRPSLPPKTSAPAATSASRAVISGAITTSTTSSSGGSSSSSDSAPHKEVQLHISETGEMSFGGGSGPSAAAHVDILQQACKILDSLETDEHSSVTPEATPPPLPTVSNGQPTSSPSRLKTSIKDSNKNEIILPLPALADAKPKLPPRAPDDTGQKRSPAAKDGPLRSRHGRLHDDSRKRSSPVGYKTLKTPPKSWNPQLPRSYIGAGQKTSSSSASAISDGVRTMSPIAPKPPRFFKMRHTASAAAVSGASAADPARAPLLMRVEPAGLGAVWPGAGDQLLPAGPLIYPHLYATQPLPFLPAAGMFAPPPAHSGVSQLTYTSAPGAFSPLLAPPPPQQHRAALTLKSTSTSSSQKMVLSSRPVPSSAAAAGGKQRPHVACSVPTSRPRPASAAPVATRLPLGAFMPTAPLGLPGVPVPGASPRLNGHPAAAAVQYRPAGEPPPHGGSSSPRSKRPRSESASTASGSLLSAPVSLKVPSPAKPPSQRGSESRPSPKPGAPPPPPAKRPGPPSALQPETKAVLPS